MKEIKTIKIGLDVATKKTGIAILIDNKPIIIKTIETPTSSKNGLGTKILADLTDIEKWLASNIEIIKYFLELSNKIVNKEIDGTQIKTFIAIENGIIPNGFNIKTSQLLSIWTGAYISNLIRFIIITAPSLFRNINMKITTPSQWISLYNKGSKEGWSKQKSIDIANKFLEKFKKKVKTDDEADALNMAFVADILEDQITTRYKKTGIRKQKIKNTKRKTLLKNYISNLKGVLTDKRTKHIENIIKAKNSKYNLKEEQARNLIDFADKQQKNNYKKWITELKELENK